LIISFDFLTKLDYFTFWYGGYRIAIAAKGIVRAAAYQRHVAYAFFTITAAG
jgi:hypothetical protein